jgi:hypothetical protein
MAAGCQKLFSFLYFKRPSVHDIYDIGVRLSMKLPCLFRSCTTGELVCSNAGIDAAWTNTAVSSFRDRTFVFAMTCINSTIAFTVRQIL